MRGEKGEKGDLFIDSKTGALHSRTTDSVTAHFLLDGAQTINTHKRTTCKVAGATHSSSAALEAGPQQQTMTTDNETLMANTTSSQLGAGIAGRPASCTADCNASRHPCQGFEFAISTNCAVAHLDEQTSNNLQDGWRAPWLK